MDLQWFTHLKDNSYFYPKSKMNLYSKILSSIQKREKLLAILIDPEKIDLESIKSFAEKIKQSPATHIFFGGSTYDGTEFEAIISELKTYLNLPILLFPGNFEQISNKADGILFLSLLSGRNPEYLIEQQLKAVPILENTNLEIIPTAYLLIESGTETAVERVSKSNPIERTNFKLAMNTAKAGEFLGMKLVYLEAGSGAKQAVPLEMIQAVKQKLTIPLIVGGGIRSKKEINDAYNAGADMVVIGTAFENDNSFFD